MAESRGSFHDIISRLSLKEVVEEDRTGRRMWKRRSVEALRQKGECTEQRHGGGAQAGSGRGGRLER